MRSSWFNLYRKHPIQSELPPVLFATPAFFSHMNRFGFTDSSVGFPSILNITLVHCEEVKNNQINNLEDGLRTAEVDEKFPLLKQLIALLDA